MEVTAKIAVARRVAPRTLHPPLVREFARNAQPGGVSPPVFMIACHAIFAALVPAPHVTQRPRCTGARRFCRARRDHACIL